MVWTINDYICKSEFHTSCLNIHSTLYGGCLLGFQGFPGRWNYTSVGSTFLSEMDSFTPDRNGSQNREVELRDRVTASEKGGEFAPIEIGLQERGKLKAYSCF